MRVCARTQISATAHTKKFAAHRHNVVDHKITTMKFTDTNIDRFLVKTFFVLPEFGHKNRFGLGYKIMGEFPEKVSTRQNFCAQRARKIRENIALKCLKPST